MDYEQLYYDVLYENKQLKKQIDLLECELKEIGFGKSKTNVELQRYIIKEIKRYKANK